MNTIRLNTIGEVIAKKDGGNSGGGAVSVSPKAVNFRDYDGTILHSYTKDEFLALTELPPLPTREGLICQEWNWDFADAVEYVTEYGVLEVGATYITDDGKTRLYITIAAEGRMDVPLYFYQSVANGVTIDWGDGSATETLSGTGKVNTTHHYNAIGDYVISLEVADGCTLGLGHGSSSYCVMGSTENNGRVYSNMLQRVNFGRNVSNLYSYAFDRCISLSSVTIPSGSIRMGEYVFRYCYSLDTIVLNRGGSLGFYSFLYCYSLRNVVLPTLSSISMEAFNSCYSLASIQLSHRMSSTAYNAFNNCYSLASVRFPSFFNSLGSNSFSNCYGVKVYDFSALPSVPSMQSTSAFTNIPSDCKIIVPDALYDEWIAATNWSTYASYIIKKSEWDALNA